MGQHFVKHIVGNGQDTFMWLDNWHTLGPLYKLFEARTLSTLGTFLFEKVSTINLNGEWNWPRPRNRVILQI